MLTPLSGLPSLVPPPSAQESPSAALRTWARRRLREEYVIARILRAVPDEGIAPADVVGHEADLVAAQRIAIAVEDGADPLALILASTVARVMDGDVNHSSEWCAWRRATLTVLRHDGWIGRVGAILWTWEEDGAFEGCALALALDCLATLWQHGCRLSQTWERDIRAMLTAHHHPVRLRAWEWLIDLAPEYVVDLALIIWPPVKDRPHGPTDASVSRNRPRPGRPTRGSCPCVRENRRHAGSRPGATGDSLSRAGGGDGASGEEWEILL